MAEEENKKWKSASPSLYSLGKRYRKKKTEGGDYRGNPGSPLFIRFGKNNSKNFSEVEQKTHPTLFSEEGNKKIEDIVFNKVTLLEELEEQLESGLIDEEEYWEERILSNKIYVEKKQKPRVENRGLNSSKKKRKSKDSEQNGISDNIINYSCTKCNTSKLVRTREYAAVCENCGLVQSGDILHEGEIKITKQSHISSDYKKEAYAAERLKQAGNVEPRINALDLQTIRKVFDKYSNIDTTYEIFFRASSFRRTKETSQFILENKCINTRDGEHRGGEEGEEEKEDKILFDYIKSIDFKFIDVEQIKKLKEWLPVDPVGDLWISKTFVKGLLTLIDLEIELGYIDLYSKPQFKKKYTERWLQVKRFLCNPEDYIDGHVLSTKELTHIHELFIVLISVLPDIIDKGKKISVPSIDVIILFILYTYNREALENHGWYYVRKSMYYRNPKSSAYDDFQTCVQLAKILNKNIIEFPGICSNFIHLIGESFLIPESLEELLTLCEKNEYYYGLGH